MERNVVDTKDALEEAVLPLRCDRTKLPAFARRLLLQVLLLVLCIASTSACAETLFSVSTPRRPGISISSADKSENALSPELRVAKQVGAQFLGVSRDGSSILGFKDTDLTPAIAGRIATLNVPFQQLSAQAPFTPIQKLIVFVNDPAVVTTAEFSGFTAVERYSPGGFVLLSKSFGAITSEDLQTLVEDPRVRYVEPNFPRFVDVDGGVPNDPKYLDHTLWALERIHAEEIWKRQTNTSLTIAVIDTGIERAHPDLGANIVSGGANFVQVGQEPADENGHGTHVAGILGAIGNNALGIVGVAWKAKILPIKIFPASGQRVDAGLDFDVVRAIDLAIASNARIINCSWAGPNFSVAVKDAIGRAEQAGILLVAAASNDREDIDFSPHYPASYANSNIVSVMASDENDTVAMFSNYGQRTVHLSAPGVRIESTLPGAGYGILSGTSQATPLVAGAAALVWSLEEYKGKPPSAIRDLLIQQARRVDALNTKNIAGGVLDLSGFGTAATVASTTAAVVPATMRLKAMFASPESAVAEFDRDGTRVSIRIPSAAIATNMRSLLGERVEVK